MRTLDEDVSLLPVHGHAHDRRPYAHSTASFQAVSSREPFAYCHPLHTGSSQVQQQQACKDSPVHALHAGWPMP